MLIQKNYNNYNAASTSTLYDSNIMTYHAPSPSDSAKVEIDAGGLNEGEVIAYTSDTDSTVLCHLSDPVVATCTIMFKIVLNLDYGEAIVHESELRI